MNPSLSVNAARRRSARSMPQSVRTQRTWAAYWQRFFIRLKHWEYWPFNVVYLPIMVYYLWLSAKARSFFFFSAANPSIETGGMLGESKIDILNRISPAYKPKSVFIPWPMAQTQVQKLLVHHGLTLPLIAKPNRGERGWQVEKIETIIDLTAYLSANHTDLIFQEYVDEPIELGVFYYRFPGQARGTISSVVQKGFLTVEGDGQSTVRELLAQNDRAVLQLPTLEKRLGPQLDQVLTNRQWLEIMPIGNHSRGTMFLNANHLITEELVTVFDQISQSIDGFYYGRYDIRCRSVEDLYAGRHVYILELNGAGAEPAHIYHPGFSLWAGYRVLVQHWQILYQISRENHRRSIPYMTFREARQVYREIKRTRKPQLAA